MERVLRREEEQLHHAESQLKLAQQAFDQFLQEKDRKAVEAQRRSDLGDEICLVQKQIKWPWSQSVTYTYYFSTTG